MNKIIHGDCLEVMRAIPDKSIDCILCDLPYGTTEAKWDTVIPFEPLWAQYKRIRKDHAPIVLFGTQPFTSLLITSNLKEFKYCWTWNKITAVGQFVAKYRPMQQTEDIAVFGKKLNYYPIMVPLKKNENRYYKESARTELFASRGKFKTGFSGLRIRNEKYPKTILTFSGHNHSSRLHSCQKPTPLLEYLLRTYTKPNDLVLDNAAGSGSTGQACLNLNRQFILIEKEQKYIDVMKARFDNIWYKDLITYE